jgi:hypothetical protein
MRRRRTAGRWQRGGSSAVAVAVAAARHRDVGDSLAAARRWRQRGSETARQRDVACWRCDGGGSVSGGGGSATARRRRQLGGGAVAVAAAVAAAQQCDGGGCLTAA